MKIAVFSIESGDDVKRVIDKIFDLSINKNISYQIYSELYKSLNLNNHRLFKICQLILEKNFSNNLKT